MGKKLCKLGFSFVSEPKFVDGISPRYTEASVSGHCLDSSGKNRNWVGKKERIFLSQKENGKIFLKKWKGFAAKTQYENVLEDFCGFEVGTRTFFSEDKREEELDLENFRPKKQKGERELDLKLFVQVKREKESKVKQVRRRVRSPVR